jgi:hypothetical protein
MFYSSEPPYEYDNLSLPAIFAVGVDQNYSPSTFYYYHYKNGCFKTHLKKDYQKKEKNTSNVKQIRRNQYPIK